MGCEVVDLFSQPDSRFPNHHPDPTIPKNLEKLISTVATERADLGVEEGASRAHDEDGRRVGGHLARGQEGERREGHPLPLERPGGERPAEAGGIARGSLSVALGEVDPARLRVRDPRERVRERGS